MVLDVGVQCCITLYRAEYSVELYGPDWGRFLPRRHMHIWCNVCYKGHTYLLIRDITCNDI